MADGTGSGDQNKLKEKYSPEAEEASGKQTMFQVRDQGATLKVQPSASRLMDWNFTAGSDSTL